MKTITIVKIATTLFLVIAELSILSILFIKPELAVTMALGITGIIIWVIWALKNKNNI
jgi:hypothetical protein